MQPKKLLALFLAVIMLALAVPVSAVSASAAEVPIEVILATGNDTYVTLAEDNLSYTSSGGTASLNVETKTLTLNGYYVRGYYTTPDGQKSSIYAKDFDLTVNLVGSNTVSGLTNNYGIRLDSANTLTITGTGSLSVSSNYTSIYSMKGINITGSPTITTLGSGSNSYGIVTGNGGNLNVSGGTITSTANCPILVSYDMTVTDGSVTAKGSLQGIEALVKLTVTGGTVSAKASGGTAISTWEGGIYAGTAEKPAVISGTRVTSGTGYVGTNLSQTSSDPVVIGFPSSGGSEEHSHDMSCECLSTSPYTYDPLPDSFTGGSLGSGRYYLTKDTVLTSTLTVSSGSLFLCLNGHKLSYASTSSPVIKFSGMYLKICDCSEAKTGKIEGGSNAVYVSSGSLWLYGGTYTGGKSGAGSYGCGVRFGGTTMYMYGGNITGSGNGSGYYGGGVYVEYGAFNMYGGTINGNMSGYGGGVYVASNKTFNMSGGTISSNTGGYYGGGVYNKGTMTLSGTADILSNNVALYSGAGIYNYSTLNISGGKIRNNYNRSTSISAFGGGIDNRGTVTMTAGEISGNTASSYGGGIYANGSTTALSGTAQVTNNTSGSYGGGIMNVKGLSLSDSVRVTGNSAVGYGGGIFSNVNSLSISDSPVVTGNTVDGASNNVFLNSSYVLTLTGALTADAQLGIYTQTARDITSGLETAMPGTTASALADYFTSDNAKFYVSKSDNSEADMTFDYQVVFDKNGGTGSMSNQTVTYNTTSALNTCGYTNGYSFKGWTTTLPDGTFAAFTDGMNVSNLVPNTGSVTSATLYAKWDAPNDAVSLSLTGTSGTNFYIDADYYLEDNVTDAYVQLAHPDNKTYSGTLVTDDPFVASAARDSLGRYRFQCKVASGQMADTIRVKLFDGSNTSHKTWNYSVKQYLEEQIGASSDANLIALSKAMAVYGGWAQSYFNYNTANPVSNILDNNDPARSVSGVTVNATPTYSQNATGITLKGNSLLMYSDTTVRHEFTLEQGYTAADYTFTVGGTVLTPKSRGGSTDTCYVDISDIPAAELDSFYTLTVTNNTDSTVTTVQYSPLCYIGAAINRGTDTTLVNLVSSMYKYHIAAKTYFGEN